MAKRNSTVALNAAPHDAARHKIVFHLDPEEREVISRAAKVRGLSLAAYVRMHALDAARRDGMAGTP